MISKETIDKIFDSSRVEEVVGEFVNLKKRGANLLGLCPFHNEKTPSFTVSPAKGIYKCFGCGASGNAVNFIMQHEQMTYPEALRFLAKKYNIEIEEDRFNPETLVENSERESLHVVSSYAQKVFTHNLLETDEGKSIGLSYFTERGFRQDIIEKFQLGYAINEWRAFTDKAIKEGHNIDFLIKSGLTISNQEGKQFDRFSGRVMFPIHNQTGRVIGFGGRTLSADKKTAKYINSPESDIYHKSKVLYGLYFAKKAIVANDVCLLVEGYTDVISLFQAGIENAVASSGTSLTADQIKLIKRYTSNITILYDGDNAGIKASFRGIDMILEEGMNVRVLLFPDGEDPDSYSKKVSSSELKNFIAQNSRDFISFKTGLLFSESKNDPIKKVELIKDIVETISLIPEAIPRSIYIKECSKLMEMDEQTLLNEVNRLRIKKLSKTKEDNPVNTEAISVSQKEDVLKSELVSAEYQEKGIVRILLQHGDKLITSQQVDEEGNAAEVVETIAQLILHELKIDNIQFENTSFNKLLQEYEFYYSSGNSIPLPADHFTKNTNDEIAKVAIDILASPYELAPWEKHNIFVAKEEDNLDKSIQSALLSLRMRKVEKMIEDIQSQIQEVTTDEDLIILLEEQKHLLQAKKTFSQQLGRVILR